MNARPRQSAGAAGRGGGADAARAAKARRTAWFLAGFAVCFYIGYMVWMYVRAASGG
jgi:hypothetical protein